VTSIGPTNPNVTWINVSDRAERDDCRVVTATRRDMVELKIALMVTLIGLLLVSVYRTTRPI
jgi:hypothetical protein